jgi:hydroxymethylbilane synthase
VRRSRKPIVIASRRSRLARVQAEMVGKALGRLHPQVDIQYRWIESEGDRHDGVMLAEHGGKGLFTSALEDALLRGHADVAVHSLKDLPAADRTGLAIAAIPPRADVRDVLISRNGAATIAELPEAAIVGTASPRRAAQLLRLRPDLRVQLLRGNVDTRLRKVLDDDAPGGPRYHATLLAAAGLKRLGLTGQLQHPIDVDEVLPAACQGALAIQCRADDHVTLTRCLPLNDPSTSTAVHAERAIVLGLSADCHSPIAVLGEPVQLDPHSVRRNSDAHWFRLRVRVLSSDGTTCLQADERCKTRELRRLVKQLVGDLTDRGARQLLASARRLPTSAAPAAAPSHPTATTAAAG